MRRIKDDTIAQIAQNLVRFSLSHYDGLIVKTPHAERGMAEPFNPYQTFLGLTEQSPDYYRLLRLRDDETDSDTISAAAQRATTRVRSHRPGQRGAEWSKLLDEIQAAKACLLDANRRADYNERLRQGTGAVASQKPAPTSSAPTGPSSSSPSMDFYATSPAAYAYPPGLEPKRESNPAAPAPNPAAPVTPAVAAPMTPAVPAAAQSSGYGYPPSGVNWPAGQNSMPQADPMAPLMMPSMPAPYARAMPMPPAGPAVAPPVAPAANPLDPMAPVSFAATAAVLPTPVGMSPEAPSRIVGYAGGATLPTPTGQVPYAMPASATIPTAQGVHAPVEMAPKPVISVKPVFKRRSRIPMLLVAGVGGLTLILAGLVYVWWQQQTNVDGDQIAQNNAVDSEPEEPATVPAPIPKAKPENKPKPAPEPEPMPVVGPAEPDPMPDPEPKPEPEPVKPVSPQPEPKPEPKPEPPPSTGPTAEELASLTRHMKDAKIALGDLAFAQAEEDLAKAETLAKLPDHKQKVLRLKAVADMAKQFHEAIGRTLETLSGGEEIKIGTSTIISVVESSREKLVVRMTGQNRTFTLDDMPLGLAVALGERSLNMNDPKTRLVKGAYVFVHRKSDAGQIEKARTWWEEAELNGVDVRAIMPVLTDKYDFDKDVPLQ